jgi:hypothetical protein
LGLDFSAAITIEASPKDRLAKIKARRIIVLATPTKPLARHPHPCPLPEGEGDLKVAEEGLEPPTRGL